MTRYVTPECLSPSGFEELYQSMKNYWGMKEYLIYMVNQTFENAFMQIMTHKIKVPDDGSLIKKLGLCAITASYTQMKNLICNDLKKPKTLQDFRLSLCFTIRHFLNMGYHVHCSYEETDGEFASFRLLVSPMDIKERQGESTTMSMAASIPEITVSSKDPMKMTEEIHTQIIQNMKKNESVDAVPYENDSRVNQEEYRERLKTPGEKPEI